VEPIQIGIFILLVLGTIRTAGAQRRREKKLMEKESKEISLDTEAVAESVRYLQDWMNQPRPRGPATEHALWTLIEFALEYNEKVDR
jgi:hypothetical protein